MKKKKDWIGGVKMDWSKEQIEKISAAMKKYADEQTKESMIKFDQTLASVVEKLGENGWTLPTELGIYAINVIGQTDDITDINKFLLEHFTENDYEYFKKMLKRIMETPISEGYKNVIDECYFAFEQKKYRICADSLISIIEGILSTFWNDKKNIWMMQVSQTKENELADEKEHLIQKYIWISYNKFIRKLYEKKDFTEDEPSFINRHWLLHGRSTYEIEEIDCLRLFNAISSLCVIVRSSNK